MSYLIDMPFVNSTDSGIEQLILDHINNNVIHISAAERNFWNNKLNYSFNEQSQNLTLNRF